MRPTSAKLNFLPAFKSNSLRNLSCTIAFCSALDNVFDISSNKFSNAFPAGRCPGAGNGEMETVETDGNGTPVGLNRAEPDIRSPKICSVINEGL
jgi:hypothetical protein